MLFVDSKSRVACGVMITAVIAVSICYEPKPAGANHMRLAVPDAGNLAAAL